MQPIGVNSDSTAVSLYRADDSTGSAAFTGLAGEVASVISEPAANAKRTIMERDFFVMCQTLYANSTKGKTPICLRAG